MTSMSYPFCHDLAAICSKTTAFSSISRHAMHVLHSVDAYVIARAAIAQQSALCAFGTTLAYTLFERSDNMSLHSNGARP